MIMLGLLNANVGPLNDMLDLHNDMLDLLDDMLDLLNDMLDLLNDMLDGWDWMVPEIPDFLEFRNPKSHSFSSFFQIPGTYNID